ncbi:Putative cytochrome c oxidase assembly protein COX14 [Septoria linicola]|uniref:Cytochrome c oxidase assembly protein COX14 n=1 Tax=Septoria linicola TaxID=215465 RepID=A0A9Q9AUH5_9PEZI|nr:Putative cytochrome c oxidase assembly protein COX14 [Septoria linicola]
MARSPSDATRFTSTGPYASSTFTSAAPSATTSSRIDFGSAPSNETPQQKIQRLRAAAALAKQGRETTFDKTVRIGRVWADRAHRVTALSLIGLTILSGAVATAGITDMLMHNRRKRNEWLAQKQIESARDLAIATQAASQGTATEDQMLLINRERNARQAEIDKQNRPGMFKRASNWLFSDLSKEEQKGGRLGAAAAATESAAGTIAQKAEATAEETKQEARHVLQAVEDKVEQHQRQGEKVPEMLVPAGGPLDRQAQVAFDNASQKTKSWTSWVTGR